MKTECKDCGGELNILTDVVVGEIVSCPDCGAEFEVTSNSEGNVNLKPAESVGEDWGE
ncbi:MAG TPA: alpha-aminoadipate/glutamate carrier protein LysW/ArgW [Nitrososphaeraceae archaeon]|jgi:alpha-aminoadipate carrier protein LysW|nr:alpha-aminoadipate/glutamate carrier protein LysW/ArgW [Nitrososphaeraceae archaeon]HZL24384.1 alpha-aminoadipate/glutamate carrier protein LysW/ArgW [Nitrososphaeraceae archaeon]